MTDISPSNWSDIKTCFAELVRLRDDNDSNALDREWKRFEEIVRSSRSNPPYHLQTILNYLESTEAAFPDIPASDLHVLDHGCGSGLTVLYLIALGYHGARGVDVGGRCEAWNDMLSRVICAGERHFHVYDGHALPMKQDSVHFIYSQQVLEHVAPNVIDAYYDEEARVAAPGALIHHQIPHRLVPYESHSRTWFVHYLPAGMAKAVYRLIGRSNKTVEQHLFLRLPSFHKKRMEQCFGHCEDITVDRLTRSISFDYYDGPVALRRLVAGFANAPLLGAIVRPILRNLVMIDTLAINRRGQATESLT